MDHNRLLVHKVPNGRKGLSSHKDLEDHMGLWGRRGLWGMLMGMFCRIPGPLATRFRLCQLCLVSWGLFVPQSFSESH